MTYLLVSLAISQLLILTGILVRPALIFFGIGFGYTFLCEQSLYNNHIYLIVLFAFLLATTNSDSCFSLFKQSKNKVVPRWNYLILQAQILIVYFYGGISKINSDWLLRQQPMRSFLSQGAESGAYPQFLSSEIAIYFFSYSGMLFDLLIGPLLVWKRTRKFAILGIVVFNLMNSQLFDDISIFPYLMIASILLFLDKSILKTKKLDIKQVGSSFNLGRVGIACFLVTFFYRLLFH